MRKQQEFKGQGFERTKDCFGGSLLKNSNAKTKRPLSTKFPVHLVLRSAIKEDYYSMRHPRIFEKINACVKKTAAKHGIKIYEYANVGNHLHILIKLRSIPGWKAFIRELTGRLSQQIQGLTGKEKGFKYFAQRPFTRIVKGWRKAYRLVKDYILLNQLEGEGIVSRLKPTRRLRLEPDF